MPNRDTQDMHDLGSRGGTAKAANRANAASTAVAKLPPLDSAENAKLYLHTLAQLAASGVLPGSQAGAAVRAVEVWLKVEAYDMDRRRIKDLEAQLAALESQLAASKGLRRVG